jgi:hypothetical protein
MKATNKEIKDFFNKKVKEYDLNIKYKRIVWNTKEYIVIEAYNNSLIINNVFSGLELQSFNTRTKIAIYTMSQNYFNLYAK